jgi:hypothetical protein
MLGFLEPLRNPVPDFSLARACKGKAGADVEVK